MRNCIIAMLMVFSSALNAQTLSGRITSSTSESLPGATVVADDTNAVSADTDGKYSILLSPGNHKIEYRFISFESKTENILINAGENKTLNISLGVSAQTLGVVVVSAAKFEQRLEDVTVSMEVIKPEIIQNRNNVTLDEAVDYIPGVNVIDGQANIRGGSGWSYGAGSRVQILVDDLPQLTADANDAKWNFLPLENLEQVEVIKGASSALFGSSALNGVINFRTGFPRDTPLTKINVYGAMYGSASITSDKKYSLDYNNGDHEYYSGLSFSHSRKIGKLDLSTGGNFFRDQGYRQGENETRGRINANLRYRFNTPGLSAGLNVNAMNAKGVLFFLWKNDNDSGYIPAPGTLSDYKTQRINLDPYLTYTNDKGSTHKIRTRYFNSTNTNNTNQNSTSDFYYLEYQYQKHFKEAFTITTGIVKTFSGITSQLYENHHGNQTAAYVQGDLSWKKFILSAGGRAEENIIDDIKDKWTPVIRSGVNYHLLTGTYLRASAGQGYRFPSVAERFIKTNIGGIYIFPNNELIPERGESYEVAIRQLVKRKKWNGYIDAALFQNNYQHMMEFVFAQWGSTNNPLVDNGFKSVNVGDTRIKGFEITIGAQFNLAKNLDLALQGGYTYLDPKQLTYDSLYTKKIGVDNVRGSDKTDFLKYRYRHMAKGDIDVKWKNISVGGSVRYTSRMENIDQFFVGYFINASFPPGLGIDDYRKYHRKGDLIIDTRISYEFSRLLTASFIIKNVTDHIFMQRPADMQPPRTFVIQAGIKF